MVSFELAADRQGVNRFLRAAANIAFAPTLGDVATTISHPPSSSHRALSERSEEHTSELQSLMRISYAVFCLKKKKKHICQLIQHVTNTPHRSHNIPDDILSTQDHVNKKKNNINN